MLKKTLKNAKVKTKSALKRFIVYCLLFIVILSFAWFVSKPESPQENIKPTPTCLKLNQKCFELEIADSDEERMKGLSDRDPLAENRGMLFIFEQSEEQCFWMKDVRFNLDMIWLNEEKEIVKIKENVSPDTYPATFCADNTKYVLEFNQGFAAKYGLKSGTRLQF